MLSGDFATYPLAELLQWLDLSRKDGVLEVSNPRGAAIWMRLRNRRVVGTTAPPSISGLGKLATFEPSFKAEALAVAAATDRLLDLFFYGAEDHFVFTTNADDGEEWLELDLAVTELLWEGLRRLDEWPRLEATYSDERMILRATAKSAPKPPELAVVLEAARAGVSISQVRLALGLSRPSILRRVELLREEGLLTVEGVTDTPDPIATLLRKAQLLVRERQFDEAALVFQTVLAADPPHQTARRLLQELEREQVAVLYGELSPLSIPVAIPGAKPVRLSPAQRETLGRINGRWDVAALTLASPLREVETLKALSVLVRRELVELRAPEAPE